MNLFLTFVLYIIVTIHILVVSIKANPSDSENESEILMRRKNSKQRNSSHRLSQSSLKELGNSIRKKIIRRKSSLNNHHCFLSIKLYLNGRQIRNSIHDTVWHDFNYENFWVNSFLIYKQKIVEHINLLRLVHGACPLEESRKLDKLAQDYSQYRINRKLFSKSLINNCGISKLFLLYSELTGAVSTLYNDRYFYSFRLNAGKGIADGFTQLVWKSTKSIGIGIARSDDHFSIVLLFYPKGNIWGQYGENVLKKQISWKKTMLRRE
uniref:CAP domain-containing protein (inferred by orthology to a zebrafish protein) n=1 Tax=Strongyloides venezuelensis TaxID=75913 RepID=A0A0K0F287_STRVS